MVLNIVAKPTRIIVKDQSYVGSARREAREFAQSMGLQESPVERLSIVVSEIASNLAKHTSRGGEIILDDASEPDNKSVRILSIDNGPGIADIDLAMLDGVSQSKTLGAGLGAIKRQSDRFEISSKLGQGTVIAAWICNSAPNGRTNKSGRERIGSVCIPHPKEKLCGDGVAFAFHDQLSSILIVDALGHGPEAHQASEIAIEAFHESPFESAQEIVQRIHRKMSGSRGAALALAQIFHDRGKLSFVGVGNIVSHILERYLERGCTSIQGIVGSQLGTLKQFDYEWNNKSTLLMHSDGIKSSARIDCSSSKSLSILAAETYRDFSRANDDASVVVIKEVVKDVLE